MVRTGSGTCSGPCVGARAISETSVVLGATNAMKDPVGSNETAVTPFDRGVLICPPGDRVWPLTRKVGRLP